MSENTPPPPPPPPPGGSAPPPPPPPPPPGPPGGGDGWGGGYGNQPPGGGYGGGYGGPPPPGGPGGYGAPGGPGGYGPRPYSVGDAFTYAWEKFKANWGPLVLIALVLVVASFVVNFLGQAITNGIAGDSGGGFFGAASILSLLFSALTFVAQLIVQAAIIKGSLMVTRNQPLSVGNAFADINFGQVVLTAIISGALFFVGLILCIVPGLIAWFLTSYALFFVVDRNLPAVEAIKASVAMVRQNVGPLLLFFLASLGVTIVGLCLCGVGLLAAYPIVALAQAYTFRTLNQDPVQA